MLVDGATLLVRARVLPRLGSPRLQPYGQPEFRIVRLFFRLVIIFATIVKIRANCEMIENWLPRVASKS